MLTTILLLVVGLVVGGLSARVDAAGAPDSAVTRVLTVAMEGDHDDVEIVRPGRAARGAPPARVLVRDRTASTCRPSSGAAGLPERRRGDLGRRPGTSLRPPRLHPRPETGVSGADRRAAVALAEVLGLSLGAVGTVGRVGVVSSLKRLLVGKPIASTEEQHQRLGIPTALAVFASDAISSTAYATEEILVVLLAATAVPALAQLPGAARHRGGRPAGDRGHELPADDLRLPRRRRCLRRVPREHLAHRRPRRRRLAPRRLHADRRGLDLLGRAGHLVRRAGAPTGGLPHPALPRLPHPADPGQPARGQGVRAASSRCRPTPTSSCCSRCSSTGWCGCSASTSARSRAVRRRPRSSPTASS